MKISIWSSYTCLVVMSAVGQGGSGASPNGAHLKNLSDKECKDMGNKFFGVRNIEGAIEAYSMAILKNGSVPHYYTNRALCYLNQKRWASAIQDARRALERDPNLVKGHFYLGTIMSLRITNLSSSWELNKQKTIWTKNLKGLELAWYFSRKTTENLVSYFNLCMKMKVLGHFWINLTDSSLALPRLIVSVGCLSAYVTVLGSLRKNSRISKKLNSAESSTSVWLRTIDQKSLN